MITIKIQCSCGQKFAFDVEPVDGQMPAAVLCPVCGVDGTAAANRVIAERLAAASKTSEPKYALSPTRSLAPSVPAVAPVQLSEPHRERKRWRVVSVVLLVGVLILIGGGGLAWWRMFGDTSKVVPVQTPADSSWPKTLAELNTYYAQPPAGQNAATVFAKGFASLQITDADRGSPDLPIFGKGKLPAPGTPLASRAKVAMTTLSQRNKVWDDFREGGRIGAARYPIDLTAGGKALLPHLAQVKQTARLGELTVLLAADDMKPEVAAEVLLASLGVAQSLNAEPLLISQLTRVSCLTIQKEALERLLNLVALPPDTLGKLAAAYAKAEQDESAGTGFTRACVGERVLALDLLGRSPEAISDWLKDTQGGKDGAGSETGNAKNGTAQSVAMKFLTRNLKAQRAFAEESFNRLLSLRKSALPERLQADAYFVSRTKEAKTNGFNLCLMLMPALGQATAREAAGLAEVRLAQTAIALERFRAANGNRLPSALGELSPRFLSTVPPDPFNGEPLKYERKGYGYELRSAGVEPAKAITFQVVKAPPAVAGYSPDKATESNIRTAAAVENHGKGTGLTGNKAGAVVAWGNNMKGQTNVPVAAQTGVTAIAAGSAHIVALKDDGSVIAWGDNQYGQTDVPAAARSGVVAIAAGHYHTVALKADGSVLAWGRVVGDKKYDGVTVPAMAQSGVKAIAAGGSQTVALKEDGTVIAWGRTLEDKSSVDVTVPPAAQSGVVAIAAGFLHILVLKRDGSVVAWGNNGLGQTDVPSSARSGVKAIAAGGRHSVALKKDGSVIAWGAGASNTGKEPHYGQSQVPAAAKSGVLAIAARDRHTVALKQDGSILAWGSNRWGETDVPVGARSGVIAIAAGSFFTVAIAGPPFPATNGAQASAPSSPDEASETNNHTASTVEDHGNASDTERSKAGAVVVWGNNMKVQTNVPTSAQAGVTAIAAGGMHAVALKADGTVLAWGDNQFGQTDVPAAARSGVVAIAAGHYHAVALKADGAVVAWGKVMKNRKYVDASVPPGAQGEVKAITAGGSQTAVLKENGTVIAWGETLEDKVYVDVSVPPAAKSGVVAIAAGYYHLMALQKDGSVIAWGNNGVGQTDVPSAARSGVKMIAAGGRHSVALREDGSVIAWGAGADNTGKDPHFGQAQVPAAAKSGVRAIAAGDRHTVALKQDGLVLAWGSNRSGETDVPGGARSGVIAIAAGSFFTVAIDSATFPPPSK